MRAAVLKELACTAPKSYFDQTSSGDNVLNGLFQLLVSSNLLAPGVSSDVNRLHGVFDVAVAHGMGRLIIDFVRQVRPSNQIVFPLTIFTNRLHYKPLRILIHPCIHSRTSISSCELPSQPFC